MTLLVVSDTSPVRALHHLDLLNLFHDLYGSVVVPEAVQVELKRPTKTCPALDISTLRGFVARKPVKSPDELGVSLELDPGERQAIALALELHADLLLIDERKGTHIARKLGLHTIGVLGVLLEAKRAGLVERLLPLVDRLAAEMNFFLSPSIRDHLGELVDERPK